MVIATTHRIVKKIVILGLLSALMACGGGGSGGGGGNTSSSVTFTATGTTHIDFHAQVTDESAPEVVTLTGKISKPLNKLYIMVDLRGENQLVREVSFHGSDSDNTGALIFHPASPVALGRGKHTQTIPVRLCEDANCQKELKGSPVKVDVQYIIDPSNPFTLSVANTEGGTVTQSADLFQCSKSVCQNEIYGSEGETLEFTAHAEPGYTFSHWSGDCTGDESCQIPFAVNGVANIKANFVPLPAEEDICLKTSIPTGASEGTLNLGETESFIPLCKGLILVSYEKRVDLIDIFNPTTPIKSFALDANPFKMQVDTTHNLLYVSHAYGNYLSRVNLNSGNVSKIYIPRVNSMRSDPMTELLVTADNGYVLVTSLTSLYDETLWIIDGSSGLRVKHLPSNISVDQGFPEFYFSTQSHLLSIHQYNELNTYFFDSTLLTITPINVWLKSSEPLIYPIAISPDGVHIASMGDTVHGDTTLQHMLAKDSKIVATWYSQPSSGWLHSVFSPLNNYVGVMNESNFALDIYAVNNNQLVHHYSGNLTECTYLKNYQPVAFSDDESIFFGMRGCDDAESASILSWTKFK